MKRTTAIIGLIIFNSGLIWLISMMAVLRFGLIVIPIGMGAAETLADELTKGTVRDILIVIFLGGLINYLFLKKIIKVSRPFLICFFISLASLIICLPFFLSARKSFLDFERGNSDLTQYIGMPISKVRLCNSKDTVAIDDLDTFISELEKAKLEQGPWKYAKTVRIIFKNRAGINDTILTNGNVFGPYKKYWFKADTNVLAKYLNTKFPNN